MYHIYCLENLHEILTDSADEAKKVIEAIMDCFNFNLNEIRLSKVSRYVVNHSKITSKFITKEYSQKQLEEFMCGKMD